MNWEISWSAYDADGNTLEGDYKLKIECDLKDAMDRFNTWWHEEHYGGLALTQVVFTNDDT